MSREKELSINVNTVAQAEEVLKSLDSLESNAQVSVGPVTLSTSLRLETLLQTHNKMTILRF